MTRPNLVPHQPNPNGTPDNRDVVEVQRQVSRLFADIYRVVPWLNGKLLTGEADASGRVSIGITLQAGVPKRLAHGLGRPYRGGFVMRDFGASPSSVREIASDHLSVTLESAADCKIYFWAW